MQSLVLRVKFLFVLIYFEKCHRMYSATSFPVSLLFTSPWDVKRRDPGNEVVYNASYSKPSFSIMYYSLLSHSFFFSASLCFISLYSLFRELASIATSFTCEKTLFIEKEEIHDHVGFSDFR